MVSCSNVEWLVRDILGDFFKSGDISAREYLLATRKENLAQLDYLYYDLQTPISDIISWMLGK